MYRLIATNSNIETGISQCSVYYNGHTFTGEAKCHPDDRDYGSERTGLTIAEARAAIKVYQFQRDCEIKPQLKILQHLYHNLSNSPHFNPKSYEAKMIRSQIKAVQAELTAIKNYIIEEKQYLKEYIDSKDKLYIKLRARNK